MNRQHEARTMKRQPSGGPVRRSRLRARAATLRSTLRARATTLRSTSRARLATLLMLAIALLPLLSCLSDRNAVVEPRLDGCQVPGDAIGRGEAIVFIRGFEFLPDTLRIEPGTRVTWVNCEEPGVEPHTSTAVGGAWNSGSIAPGGAFSHTFGNAGISGYFCQPHPFMEGAIIVQ